MDDRGRTRHEPDRLQRQATAIRMFDDLFWNVFIFYQFIHVFVKHLHEYDKVYDDACALPVLVYALVRRTLFGNVARP